MKEFEVTIDSRPLGVRFAHADRGETVVVHLVLEGRLGDKLGLEPGDILIGVNGSSVVKTSSSDALELFRSQKLPYKASFRRYEEEDEFDDSDDDGHSQSGTNTGTSGPRGAGDSDDDDSRNSSAQQTMFMKEEKDQLMASLAVTPYHRKAKSVQLRDWSVSDVQEWLINYGRALGDESRFTKYVKIFSDNKIDGKILRGLDRIDLSKMGIEDDDVHDLYVGVKELNNIIAITSDTLRKAHVDDLDGKSDDGGGGDSKADDGDGAEDSDHWEAPFLPYMYDAPTIELSDKTHVKVESARIVSPYKKKPFALYEVEVIDGDNEWLLSKRYTEFYKFHNTMKGMGISTKAKFPGKGLLKSSTDKKVIEDRQRKLTNYINCLLQKHPKARNSKAMNDFLSPSRTFIVDQ